LREGQESTSRRNNNHLWLWVPAFAGTTAEFVARLTASDWGVGRLCRSIPHRRCRQNCLASWSPQIAGIQLGLWGGLDSFGSNDCFLPGFVCRLINAGLIHNSAKKGSNDCIKHRNTSYYHALACSEIRIWAGLQFTIFAHPRLRRLKASPAPARAHDVLKYRSESNHPG